MTAIAGAARAARPDFDVSAELVLLYRELFPAGLERDDDKVLWLVLLLLSLFAEDDGGLLPPDSVRWIINDLRPDGSDVGPRIRMLYDTIGTPVGRRHPHTADYERYGRLPHLPWFAGRHSEPVFTGAAVGMLQRLAGRDLRRYDPAAIAAVFQIEADPLERRKGGLNFTPDDVVGKVLGPRLLDGLEGELRAAGRDAGLLLELRGRLSRARVLDPACGSGMFLVGAFRGLRRVESEVCRRLVALGERLAPEGPAVVLGNFHGIEPAALPRGLAELLMLWTAESEDQRFCGEFECGLKPGRSRFSVVAGDALALDWSRIMPMDGDSVIVGNVPFAGIELTPKQVADRDRVWFGFSGAGELDYSSCWLKRAEEAIGRTDARAAFVTTASLYRGRQAPVIATALHERGMRIDFAHAPFEWSNGAPGESGVHVAVVGFSREGRQGRSPVLHRADGAAVPAPAINWYLASGDHVAVRPRRWPARRLSRLSPGVDFSDGAGDKHGTSPHGRNAGLILEEDGYWKAMADPAVAPYVRRIVGGHELVQGGARWCLWLVGLPAPEVGRLRKRSAFLDARLTAVEHERAGMAGRSRSVRPWLPVKDTWTGSRTDGPAMVFPNAGTGWRRRYFPVGVVDGSVVPSSTVDFAPARDFDFAAASSRHFRLWIDAVAGRRRDDPRFNRDHVWNTFRVPDDTAPTLVAEVEAAGRAVLAARTPGGVPLKADYDAGRMSRRLLEAHLRLDRALDATLGLRPGAADEDRLARLLELYLDSDRQMALPGL